MRSFSVRVATRNIEILFSFLKKSLGLLTPAQPQLRKKRLKRRHFLWPASLKKRQIIANSECNSSALRVESGKIEFVFDKKGEFQMQSFWARRLETGNIAPDSIGNSSPLYFSAFLH